MTPEKTFQNEVIKYLKKHKIWHYRSQMGNMSGLPDIIACYEGIFVGIELKRPDGKGRATQQQLLTIDQIFNAGGIAGVIESIDQLEKLLRLAAQARHTLI